MSDLRYEDCSDFNEHFDDTTEWVKIGESEYEPSKVLFYVDSSAYEHHLIAWKQEVMEERRNMLLALRGTRENARRIDELKELVNDKAIVPFVGAGMTVPCDMPAWTPFLIGTAVHAGIYDKEQAEFKLKNGEYEEVAEDIVDAMGVPGFDEMVDGKFKLYGPPEGPILDVPSLSNGCVVTTNFDEVLERVYGDAGLPFERVMMGRSCGGFNRAMVSGKRWLLKLHGTSFSSHERVLTLSEYKTAYGDSCIDYGKNLPGVLEQIITRSRLLFLGCSLLTDRTLDLFEDVINRRDSGKDAPRHYAIVENTENSNLTERERFLNDRHIFPIWYPPGEHEYVEIATAFLTGRM